MSSSTQASRLEPLPNLRFTQHNSLFLTKTKKKKRVAQPVVSEESNGFEKGLGDRVTPDHYFDACFNFHSKLDTRIDMKNFSQIKSDVRQLFGKQRDAPAQVDPGKTQGIRMNDLSVLVESLSQEKALSQSTLDRDLRSQQTNEWPEEPPKEEGFAKLSESGTNEEDSLKQSFISFLGTGDDKGKPEALAQLPDLLADIQFQKKLNFSHSNSDQTRASGR